MIREALKEKPRRATPLVVLLAAMATFLFWSDSIGAAACEFYTSNALYFNFFSQVSVCFMSGFWFVRLLGLRLRLVQSRMRNLMLPLVSAMFFVCVPLARAAGGGDASVAVAGIGTTSMAAAAVAGTLAGAATAGKRKRSGKSLVGIKS